MPVITNDTHPSLPGITCRSYGGSRLHVYRTKTSTAVGLVIHYRECADCEARMRTREYVESVIRPGRPKEVITVPAPGETPSE